MGVLLGTEEKLHRRVLARKYRPQALNDLIGQDVLVQALTKGLRENHLPQAVLFHGIRGTGKTSTARILAKAVNCLGPDPTLKNAVLRVDPCGRCASCKAMEEDRHLDVVEMDAASHTGVDDIREIIDSAQYKAVLGRYKVFIIDEVHMLSKSAFNALLKTLEEPPSHVLFLFATTEFLKIPETILSRCACFLLKRVDSPLLMKHFQNIADLEGFTIEKEALAFLARAADGSVRDGLTLLDQSMNLTEAQGQKLISGSIVQSMLNATDRHSLYDLLASLLQKKSDIVISLARDLSQVGADPVIIMQDLLECLYRAICLKIVPSLSVDESIPDMERKKAHEISRLAEKEKLLSLWKMMLKGYEDVKKAPFALQALEMVLLRLCFAVEMPSIDQILRSVECVSKGEEAQTPPWPTEVTAKEKSAETLFYAASSSTGASAQSEYAPEEIKTENSGNFVKIHSLPELIDELQNDKELILLTYVKKDFSFISFENGEITLSFNNNDAEKILPLLKRYLKTKTGQHWTIQKSQQAAPSLQDKEDQEQLQRQQKILETPVIKKIQELFPDGAIHFKPPSRN
jgi:DNA polymerase-3 subunit gamma/tau